MFNSFKKQLYNTLLLKIDLANFVSLIELSSVGLLLTDFFSSFTGVKHGQICNWVVWAVELRKSRQVKQEKCRIFKINHDLYFAKFSIVWCINMEVVQNHSFKYQLTRDFLTVMATIVIFVWIIFSYKLYKWVYLINILADLALKCSESLPVCIPSHWAVSNASFDLPIVSQGSLCLARGVPSIIISNNYLGISLIVVSVQGVFLA